MSTNTKVKATFDGKTIWITEGSVHAYDALAKSMGYEDHTVFTCYQGGWMPASKNSANTHRKEAQDISPFRWQEKVWNGRRIYIWLDRRKKTSKWIEHIHGARLDPGADFLDPSMTGQQNEYVGGGDGLVGNLPDDDQRPRYPNGRFVDDGVHERWVALKATQGFDQAGGHAGDAIAGRKRAKGWVFPEKNIATVRVKVNGVWSEWLVSSTMTFYRKADFAIYTGATAPKPPVAKPPASVLRPPNTGKPTMIPKSMTPMYHAPIYAIGNSIPLGLETAESKGIRWSDLDLHISKDGEFFLGHDTSPRDDGFIITPAIAKKYGKNPTLEKMLAADIKTLRTHPIAWGGKKVVVRYHTLEEAFAWLADHPNQKVSLELKQSKPFENPATFAAIAALADKYGIDRKRIAVMSIPRPYYKHLARFKAAHPYFTTMALRSLVSKPSNWAAVEPYVDHYRGNWKR